MSKANLSAARAAKNDEFYTQWYDIETEINAYLEFDPDVFRGKTILLPCDDPEWSNFTKYFALRFEYFGLKKIISTSYAPASKRAGLVHSPTKLETDSPKYDEDKSRTHGKKFTLEPKDVNANGVVNIDSLQWEYLEGDGDFRSAEVTALRDEADFIITNPPFSLFREFLAWVVEADKKFLLVGNINAITYKETFPLIKDNKMWLGPSITSGDREFVIPKSVVDLAKFTGEVRKNDAGEDVYYQRVVGVRWFTNMDHGRRHKPLVLMNAADNKQFSKSATIREHGYRKYDNYDAIEVPLVMSIPSDYTGVMGVPISFLDKHCPEQFEILGCTESEGKGLSNGLWDEKSGIAQAVVSGQRVYKRIFIQPKNVNTNTNTNTTNESE